MKTVRIYGKLYEVHPTCKKEPTLFWHSNTLTDEPLSYEPDGYIRMDDGNIVGVYSKKRLFVPLILGIVIILGLSGGYLLFKELTRPHALEGTFVKVAQPGNNEINFNTFLQCNGTVADVRFSNGQSSVRISVEGDGIESKPQVVQPNETLLTIPMHFNTQEAVVEAQLVVEQDGAKYTYPIIVEIPDNMAVAGGSITGTTHLISEDAHPFSEETLIQ